MASQTVLITGCSSGFGRMMVPRFLSEGWSVIATSRSLPTGFETNERLQCLKLDVTLAADRENVTAFIEKKHGGTLGCLVNNAGYGLFGALEDMSEEQLRHQMEVNFFGTALLTRALLPSLRAAGGRVICLSSSAGTSAMPLSSAYCASKFAIEGFGEALYHELRPHGVSVSIVEPGGFRTRFGANIRWSVDAKSALSPYRTQSRNFLRVMERLSSGKGTSPTPVVEAILRLSRMSSPPLRVRLGKDAKMAHLILRLLPGQVSVALLRMVYGKVLLKAENRIPDAT